MIRSLFGPNTRSAMLRGGLEEQSLTQKAIGARIAGATSASANTDFAAALARGTAAQQPEVDLQREMVHLADVQLRYEASAKLLHETYAQLRTAIRSNG